MTRLDNTLPSCPHYVTALARGSDYAAIIAVEHRNGCHGDDCGAK